MAAKDTDNAVILPILCAVMRERASGEESESGHEVAKYQRSTDSQQERFLGWMVASGWSSEFIIFLQPRSAKTRRRSNEDSAEPSFLYAASLPQRSCLRSALYPEYARFGIQDDVPDTQRHEGRIGQGEPSH